MEKSAYTVHKEALEVLLRNLLACHRIPALYPPEHPLQVRALKTLLDCLDYFWSLENPLYLLEMDEDILLNGKFSLFEHRTALGRLLEIFQHHRIKKLSIFKGVAPEELGLLFRQMSFTLPPLLKETDRYRIGNFLLLESNPPEAEKSKKTYDSNLKGSLKLYDDALEVARVMSGQLREERSLNPKEIKELAWSIVGHSMKQRDLMVTMAHLKNYDDYTFTHSVNVSILTLAQGQSLNLPEKVLHEFAVAGLTHDAGKEFVPLAILNKPGKLTDEEFSQMRSHSQEGARILRNTPNLPFLCPVTAFEHHIKYDGSGYPRRGFSQDHHLASWLATIADVYDALRSIRPYRGALPSEKVLSIMRDGEGKDFHPYLLNRFFRLVGIYHRGTVVLLDNNAIAVVYKVNKLNPQRPLVKVICRPDGTQLSVPYVLNLTERSPGGEQFSRSIQGTFESPHLNINPLDYL
jgi:HD-GYP domain-containing protein (c-di-GMP phosphodiesterase class II)